MSAFFNVVREPAFATFNGVTQEINKDVLFNEDTGNVLGVVSKQYNLVKNDEVKSYFDEAFGGYNVTVLNDHLSNNDAKWVREVVFNDDQFVKEILPSDVVNLKLKIWNGYGDTSIGFGLEGYRQVCKNGMMGWRDMFSTKLIHWGKDDIINTIRNSFTNQFNNYQVVFDKMAAWAKEPFTQKDFGKFIDIRTKTDEKHAERYLTEKQAEGIKAQFPVVMNRYNEAETVWGSYNVLTAIATHETATKSSKSNLFTHGYKRMERLTEDFVKLAA